MEVCPDVREKELVDKVTFLQNKVESLNEELSHLKKKLLCSHFQCQFHANDVFSTSVETVSSKIKRCLICSIIFPLAVLLRTRK